MDVIGKWSEHKLELFEKYLTSYSKIMNNQKTKWLRGYHYIDAFAGSGKHFSKTYQEYIAGSTLRALRSTPSFDCYWFIDLSSKRVKQLEDLKQQFPHLEIRIKRGNCNEILCNEIILQLPYASKKRGLVFLDPYGLQVDFTTVEKLATVRTLDVFVNFSLMGITRILKRDKEPTGKDREFLNRVFGSSEWIQEIYKPSRQLELFGDPHIKRNEIRAEWIARLYSNLLSQLFTHVSDPVIMRNSKNSPLYALFLTSHNKNGVKIANDVFSRFENLRKLGQ